MMIRILHLSQNKTKKILNELVDERLEKITDLNEGVNNDNLTYRYKGNTDDVKFDQFDNALHIVNKIRDGKKNLVEIKNNQQKFKSVLEKIKKGYKSKEQKNTLYNIEIETKLLNFMMIIF